MTVLVGVACQDGVVIGTDSMVTFGPAPGDTTMTQTGQTKIEIIGGRVIVAHTGSIGFAQRATAQIRRMWEQNEFTGTPLEISTLISHRVNADFQRTITNFQAGQLGWRTGALVAFSVGGAPAALFEFDQVGYHPEQKASNSPYIAAMGSGVRIAEPHMALVKRVFWKDRPPLVGEAVVAALWTLQHTIELNPGGVGGEPQVAVLRSNQRGVWTASILDAGEAGEAAEMARAIEDHLREFRLTPTQDRPPQPK